MTGDPDKPVFVSPDWDAPDNVVAFTSTRLGGSSRGPYTAFNLGAHVGDEPGAVAGNRELLARRLDQKVEFQWLRQVHGTEVFDLTRITRELPEADAVVTGQRNMAACVLTADCLPVFLASQDGSVIAIAHAGWRGLAAGILENTVARMPVPAHQLVAWLGPAIGPCHFQVGAEVRERFVLQAPDSIRPSLAEAFVEDSSPGKYRADLYRLALLKLNNLGVESVGGGGYCTYCETEKFYSYRRNPITGRMVSLICLRD